MIVFTSDRAGNKDIFVMHPDGSQLFNFTVNPASDWFPKWSPEGMWIAFLSDRDGPTDIYKMNAAGGGMTRLTNTPDNETYLVWSPDGTRIAFVSDKDIFVVNADGSGLTNLTDSPGNYSAPDWTLTEGQPPSNTCGAGWTRVSVGKYAIVTQGDLPNRVRSEPKVADNIINLLYPGSIIKILEGPVCADGLVFWKVENAAIPGGMGWTAEGDGKEYWLASYTP
jgi:dipeptidyl aminopeptidase/acylaminoacyl peptidase